MALSPNRQILSALPSRLSLGLVLGLAGLALSSCATTDRAGSPDYVHENSDPEFSLAPRPMEEYSRADSYSGRAPASSPAPDPDALERYEEAVAEAMERSEILAGMTMDQVAQSWGPPTERELAGPEASGNQLWIYFEGIGSSRFGTAAKRYLYFESGRLAGWQTR